MTYHMGEDEPAPPVTSTLLYERVDGADQQPMEQHYLLYEPNGITDQVMLDLTEYAAMDIKVIGYSENKTVHLDRHQVTLLCEIALAWQKRVVEHEEIRRAARLAAKAKREAEEAEEETRRLVHLLKYDVSLMDGAVSVLRPPQEGRITEMVFSTWQEAAEALAHEWYGTASDAPETIPF